MNSYINVLTVPSPDLGSMAIVMELLASHFEPIEFAPGQVITDWWGDKDRDKPSDTEYIYCIKSGRTNHVITGSGVPKYLYQLDPGWIFGNFSTRGLSQGNDITVTALVRTVVYKMPRADYLSLIMTHPDFAAYVLTLMGILHGVMCDEVGNLVSNSCKTRLMRVFCAQADKNHMSDDGEWYYLDEKLTHNELAATVGSARVTVSKLINELCDEGFLRIINRRTQVNVKASEEFMSLAAAEPTEE